jgi:hypothetical protein
MDVHFRPEANGHDLRHMFGQGLRISLLLATVARGLLR